MSARESGAVHGERSHRRREVPLALIMVALTTLTLWSLGQALVVQAPAAAAQGPVGAGAGDATWLVVLRAT